MFKSLPIKEVVDIFSASLGSGVLYMPMAFHEIGGTINFVFLLIVVAFNTIAATAYAKLVMILINKNSETKEDIEMVKISQENESDQMTYVDQTNTPTKKPLSNGKISSTESTSHKIQWDNTQNTNQQKKEKHIFLQLKNLCKKETIFSKILNFAVSGGLIWINVVLNIIFFRKATNAFISILVQLGILDKVLTKFNALSICLYASMCFLNPIFSVIHIKQSNCWAGALCLAAILIYLGLSVSLFAIAEKRFAIHAAFSFETAVLTFGNCIFSTHNHFVVPGIFARVKKLTVKKASIMYALAGVGIIALYCATGYFNFSLFDSSITTDIISALSETTLGSSINTLRQNLTANILMLIMTGAVGIMWIISSIFNIEINTRRYQEGQKYLSKETLGWYFGVSSLQFFGYFIPDIKGHNVLDLAVSLIGSLVYPIISYIFPAFLILNIIYDKNSTHQIPNSKWWKIGCYSLIFFGISGICLGLTSFGLLFVPEQMDLTTPVLTNFD